MHTVGEMYRLRNEAIINAGAAEYSMSRDDPAIERGAREAVRGMMVRLGLYTEEFYKTIEQLEQLEKEQGK